MALPAVAWLAGGLGVRPAANRACVAAQTVPRPVAPPETAGNTWPACSCQGGARPDSPDVASQSDMGFAPDCRRTPEARYRGGEIDRGEVLPTTQETIIPYVEDLSEE